MVSKQEIKKYVEQNIGDFHQSRLDSLEKLKFDKILKRKNPYLFKAKNIIVAADFVKFLLDAYLSSQEESLFGDFLEGLAVFVCSKSYDGRKSAAEGIDLEFEKENKRYIISIKSGPNWGNSGQIKKMRDNFRQARKILGGNISQSNIVAVNGCCYGRDNKPDKGDYLKICGQRFWELISGNNELYTELIEPLGHKAKESNDSFSKTYATRVNKFTVDFTKEYCDKDFQIMWDKIVKINSGEEQKTFTK